VHKGGNEAMNNGTKWMIGGASAVAAGVAVELLSRRSGYSFRDKAVFITGGSRGLGLLMAREFAEEGARLTLVSRDSKGLQAAESELMDTGARVLTFSCDVRDRDQAKETIDASVKLQGSIDVLINNAGIIQVGPFEDMGIEDFEAAMATHAWGSLYTILAALPHMRRQGGGRIVNISSIGGKIAVPHLMPYAMSKFALAGLSDGMRAELPKYGIRVTSVYPGLMRSGSHVYAQTKGDQSAESAWFSFLATNPLFAVDARRAARQIVEACRKGRPELVISIKAKLAVMAQGIAPSLVARMSALVNRFLPGPVTEIEERRAA
jgi:NAD(P)-dependent dehydrogenase (short-subunit alcohol dehydrogenase family)